MNIRFTLALMAGAALTACLPAAFAQSYEIVFTQPVQAGNVTLDPGSYSIGHKGDMAVFTNLQSGDSFRVPVTVAELAQKNNATHVVMTNKNGTQEIQKVDVGGRSIELDFAD